jgi:hypothetical protein
MPPRGGVTSMWRNPSVVVTGLLPVHLPSIASPGDRGQVLDRTKT